MYYLFSQSPGSGGENAYKLAGSPHSSSLRLLFAQEPTLLFALFLSVSFFPHLPSSYILWCFLFVLLLFFFFFLVAFQAAAHGWSISTTGPQHSCGRTLPAPSVFTLFFSHVLFFSFFGEQRPFDFFFFLSQKCTSVHCGFTAEFFVIIIITITAREEICKGDQVLALMEQQDNTAWSSSEGELAVEHMCYIVGLNDRRKSRTTTVEDAVDDDSCIMGTGEGGGLGVSAPSTTITTGEQAAVRLGRR